MRLRRFLFFVFAPTLLLAAEDIVFRSDVSLVRVDAQVVDRNNRAITGLTREDFVLRENGTQQEIRNFATEDMPVDVLLLVDVSGSMRSHVERVASASGRAMRVLADGDRVGIMVFNRSTRLRMPLRAAGDLGSELDNLLRQESFNGGTDITRALYDAAEYMKREGRREARRAIVILTDDQTERDRDERGVGRALASGDIVLSALIAPSAAGRVGMGGGGWPPVGGGGPLGGIILGRRGGSRFPGGGGIGGGTHSAGTERIARESGGDSMRVEEASAFEMTLERLRQRYALHFLLPEGVKPGQERDITVELTATAQRRNPGAEVRFRRLSDSDEPGRTRPVIMSERRADPPAPAASPAAESGPRSGGWRRAGASGGEGGSRGPQIATADSPESATEAPTVSKPAAAPVSAEEPKRGGWRRVGPGETP